MKKRKVKDKAAVLLFGVCCYSTILALIIINGCR